MVFGTLYTFPVSNLSISSLTLLTIPLQGDQPRTIAIKAVAKANGLDLNIVEEPKTVEHYKVSKLGKVPALQGEDGLKLFECIAIAIYSTYSRWQYFFDAYMFLNVPFQRDECNDLAFSFIQSSYLYYMQKLILD